MGRLPGVTTLAPKGQLPLRPAAPSGPSKTWRITGPGVDAELDVQAGVIVASKVRGVHIGWEWSRVRGLLRLKGWHGRPA